MRFVIIAAIATFLSAPLSAAPITWTYTGNPLVDSSFAGTVDETRGGFKMSLTVSRNLLDRGSLSIGGDFATRSEPAKVFFKGEQISGFPTGFSYSGICEPFQSTRFGGDFSIRISNYSVTSSCSAAFDGPDISHASGGVDTLADDMNGGLYRAPGANWERVPPVPLPAAGLLLSLGLLTFTMIGRISRKT